jgi:integrase
VFLYRWHGKPTEIGFGSARAVPLARARELAAQARVKLADGDNPRDVRKRTSGATFGECADRLIAAMKPSWRHPRHISSWEMTMRAYAAPLRHIPVNRITTDDVLSVLKPLWTKLPETASRLRGRIERVLDAAKAQGLRTGENPARWRGHLDQLLPQRQAITRGHYEALRYEDVPACIGELRSRQSIPSLALEFIILTAARCGEAVGARWDEVNLESGVWTVPVSRMKAARQHRVPLSRRAREILAIMRELHHGEYVFPSSRHHGKPLGARTVWWAIRAIRTGGATVHGFRSSFRDWAAECTDFSNEVCEAALAHAVTNKVEAAYRRGDLFEKRRKLMDAWAEFCEPNALPQVAEKDVHTLRLA